MLYKNRANQAIGFELLNRSDGSPYTGATPLVYRVRDGGSQELGTGVLSNAGNGQWSYVMSAEDCNCNQLSLSLNNDVIICVEKTIIPFDPFAPFPFKWGNAQIGLVGHATRTRGGVRIGKSGIGLSALALLQHTTPGTIHGATGTGMSPHAPFIHGRTLAGAVGMGVVPGGRWGHAGLIFGSGIVGLSGNSPAVHGRSVLGAVGLGVSADARPIHGRALAGAVGLGVVPGGRWGHAAVLGGAVGLGLSPHAPLVHGRALASASPVGLSPHARPIHGRALAGASPVGLSPHAPLVHGRALAGGGGIGQSPAAVLTGHSAVTDTPMITTTVLGTPRNNATIYVGCVFTPGFTMTVTYLGRWFIAGNTQIHTLSLDDPNTHTNLALATWDPSVLIPGSYQYIPISPVVLTAGTQYALSSLETSGGDYWYDNDTSVGTAYPVSAAFSAYGFPGAYLSSTGIPVSCYVPVNLLFH